MQIYTPKVDQPLIKALLYGSPGVGKTTLASEAMDHPSLGQVLFLNIEGGLLTISHRRPNVIDIGRNEDGSPNGHALDDLEKVVWAIVNKEKGFEKFKTVVLDSVTELQVRDLEDVVAEDKKKKPNRDITLVQRDDYGKNTTRMRRILRMLRDAPVNVIFTALAKKSVPEGGDASKPTSVTPHLTAALAESLMGYVDFLWYLYSDGDGVRTLLTQERGPFKAKTRQPQFADKIGVLVKNPNLATLYTQLCESIKESK